MDLMSKEEWKRVDAVERAVAREVTTEQAAQIAGLSKRQLRRLCRRYEAEGVTGLAHRNRGRAPPNGLDRPVRQAILDLRKGLYEGFNDQHFTEKLNEIEGIRVSRSTVRRVLRTAQIRSPHTRRPRKYRKRRERRGHTGALVLWDGSSHDWLEGRGQKLCLMGAVDDATGKLLRGAHFVEQEGSVGYLRLLVEMTRHHGIPQTIYMDKHSSLRRNDKHWTLEEELAGKRRPTEVTRALETLGIQVIYADSPQAKGRVERAWGTLQDRLCSELRLAGVSTLEQANAILATFRSEYNRRFARKPKQALPAWRKPHNFDLAEVCSFHSHAQVKNDHTIQYQNRVIDLPAPKHGPSLAGKRVDLRHLLDGTLRVYREGRLVHQLRTEPPATSPRQLRKPPHSSRTKTKKPSSVSTKLSFQQIVAKNRMLAQEQQGGHFP